MLPGRYGGFSIEFSGQLFTEPATKFEISFISCTNKCGHHLNIFSIQTTIFSPSEHLFKSEMRLVEFMMKLNVNLRV